MTIRTMKELPPEMRLAYARDALDGMPFGFTRERVKEFRALMGELLYGHSDTTDEDRELWEWHLQRIEALLPSDANAALDAEDRAVAQAEDADQDGRIRAGYDAPTTLKQKPEGA